MRKIGFLLLLVFVFFSCKKTQKTAENQQEKIKIATLNYEQLKPLLHKNDGKTYVVNFWATWCIPCVKELPAFEKLNQEFKDKNVEVVLVSLDFSRQLETNLIPFIKEKKLQSKIIHFEDSNEQFWIKDIAENWTGSIPATLIYNAKKRKFYEQPFHYETLKNELQTFLN
ncbi:MULTISPECIES: TlpA disulfide reductase family protein [unclassified Tenacibaculum]|uniref:TlpA disulfide reductase family protein n=1 Tax=unclassified Tenacibaculum TaxID=2635139 RepID=UPI001F2BE01E|nr:MULTISPECIES: TlpA disulfide reductase family protein [unclassified Tenacibaculum]MCF2876279.1 TlpA family protein disulfide reductase [Tenacibaculum sp. Cn5-1]MCF2936354.1 TlpA family protein disulfide reductase [Tenacibaculum sp. Cn5-34]MCG7511697.1 TlpA family protein disulfide reductase [Tenacibaculum sp. Cn5-46]